MFLAAYLLCFYLLIPIVAGCAVWVARDSARLLKNIPQEEHKSLSRLAASPKGWTIGTLFLWLIYFPAYLSARVRYIGTK